MQNESTNVTVFTENSTSTYRYRNMPREQELFHVNIPAIWIHIYTPQTQTTYMIQWMGAMYYSEHLHLFRQWFEHICVLAIYYGINAQIMTSKCNANYLTVSDSEPTVWGTEEQHLLFILLSPWTLVCEPDYRPFWYPCGSFTTIKIMEICECSFIQHCTTFNRTILPSSTMVMCNDMGPEPDFWDKFLT